MALLPGTHWPKFVTQGSLNLPVDWLPSDYVSVCINLHISYMINSWKESEISASVYMCHINLSPADSFLFTPSIFPSNDWSIKVSTDDDDIWDACE